MAGHWRQDANWQWEWVETEEWYEPSASSAQPQPQPEPYRKQRGGKVARRQNLAKTYNETLQARVEEVEEESKSLKRRLEALEAVAVALPTSKAPPAVKLTQFVDLTAVPDIVLTSAPSASSASPQAVLCGLCGGNHYGRDCDRPKNWAERAQKHAPQPAEKRDAKIHVIVDWNGTLNVAGRGIRTCGNSDVPYSFIRRMQRLTDFYGVIFNLLSFISINDPNGHWKNLCNQVDVIEKEAGHVFEVVERCHKKSGNPHYSPKHRCDMSGKDYYAFEHKCVAILDNDSQIIKACTDCGLATYEISSRCSVDDALSKLEERIKARSLPQARDICKPYREWDDYAGHGGGRK